MRQEEQSIEDRTRDVLSSIAPGSGKPENRMRQQSKQAAPAHDNTERAALDEVMALAHTLVAQLPTESAIPRALAICARLLPDADGLRLFAPKDGGTQRLTLVGEVRHADGVDGGFVAHDVVRDVVTLGLGEVADRRTLRERAVYRREGAQALPLESASGALVGVFVVNGVPGTQADSVLLSLCADTLTVLLDRLRQERLSARVEQALAVVPALSAPDDDDTTGQTVSRRALETLTALAQPVAALILTPDADGTLRTSLPDAEPAVVLDATRSAELLGALRGERSITLSAGEHHDLWDALAMLRRHLEQSGGVAPAHLTLLPAADGDGVAFVLALAHATRTNSASGWLPAARMVMAATEAGLRTLRLRREVAAEGRARDEYISLAGHELRSPLTSIKGYAQLLARQSRKTVMPESMVRSVDAIEQQSLRMADMVGELLDASRIQRNRLEVNLARTELVPIALKVVERRRVFYPQHSIELDIGAEVLVGHWDVLRVEQILRDLLDNAARFSPEGGPITIRLERQNGDAVVRVLDCGIGVADGDRARIFDYLYRAPEAEERNLSGLGLGLYICRYVAQRMGGSLALRETRVGEGSGSEFALTLPLA